MPVPPSRSSSSEGTNTVVGPFDASVKIPRGSAKTDWGSGARGGHRARVALPGFASPPPPLIAGYCVSNDVSERAFQLERGGAVDQGQVLRHLQSARTVAGDARRGSPDPQALGMHLDVNGACRAQAGWQHPHHGLRRAPPGALPTQFMTLEPGDLTSPPGRRPASSLGQKPHHASTCALAAMSLELEIDGLGVQRQRLERTGRPCSACTQHAARALSPARRRGRPRAGADGSASGTGSGRRPPPRRTSGARRQGACISQIASAVEVVDWADDNRAPSQPGMERQDQRRSSGCPFAPRGWPGRRAVRARRQRRRGHGAQPLHSAPTRQPRRGRGQHPAVAG